MPYSEKYDAEKFAALARFGAQIAGVVPYSSSNLHDFEGAFSILPPSDSINF